jgi:hypothetical protein
MAANTIQAATRTAFVTGTAFVHRVDKLLANA